EPTAQPNTYVIHTGIDGGCLSYGGPAGDGGSMTCSVDEDGLPHPAQQWVIKPIPNQKGYFQIVESLDSRACLSRRGNMEAYASVTWCDRDETHWQIQSVTGYRPHVVLMSKNADTTHVACVTPDADGAKISLSRCDTQAKLEQAAIDILPDGSAVFASSPATERMTLKELPSDPVHLLIQGSWNIDAPRNQQIDYWDVTNINDPKSLVFGTILPVTPFAFSTRDSAVEYYAANILSSTGQGLIMANGRKLTEQTKDEVMWHLKDPLLFSDCDGTAPEPAKYGLQEYEDLTHLMMIKQYIQRLRDATEVAVELPSSFLSEVRERLTALESRVDIAIAHLRVAPSGKAPAEDIMPMHDANYDLGQFINNRILYQMGQEGSDFDPSVGGSVQLNLLRRWKWIVGEMGNSIRSLDNWHNFLVPELHKKTAACLMM
ncbi:MAG: RICIN domain-containing protein, partial [Enterobacteriaceae bacterium]